ncbi:2-polyprenylphenol 6-hydroxylase [Candidatus Pelagibacter bacterium]|nr:2-polyprenylphenol 6-hydroxylase [Candidatus Pelagibacter bacterium]MDA8676603.1 2-polyprenylphenol 6-hydroxylase [Candidatus Pelagibacter bacterium]MDA8764310.1 2-polyprenylphenol 6-hydroxylase [Candidatus Pelagibacter bacterium]MDA8772623.1 2-polyprenylphenol 6-hydroxylase [Candidatus Pelagibacter bacterium]
MFRRIFRLFQIARKLSTSGAVENINQVHEIPTLVNLFFSFISIGSNTNRFNDQKTSGERLCIALQGMGTTFIKLGQFLATRPDIIGEEISKDLEKLQDKVPAFDLYDAKKIIKKEIGEKQFNNIIEISEPIAAASIAQVHIAKIKNENQEKEVAIKILRPDIERLFNEELDALMLFAYIIENTIPKAKRLKLVEVVHLLREITNIEMDLRFEAAAANELYENTEQDHGFNVPKIYWNYTTKKILTLDKVEGISIREHDKLKNLGVDLKKLAENLIQHFLKQAVRDGFFHGDMHQGNLFVDNKGNIIPVDFGIMGRLDKNNRKFLAEILYGFIKRDYVKVAEVHFQAGLVPQDASKDEFAQALRSVGEPIFGQTIKDISGGNLLAQLFEITEKFNMATQPSLLLLQKNMVVVEGVARKLFPETNIWEVSRPVLENWLKNIKSPKSTIDTALNTSAEIIKRIPDFPDLMDRADYALKLMAEGKLSLGISGNKGLEIEQMKLKNFRNNIIISFFGIVIICLLVF